MAARVRAGFPNIIIPGRYGVQRPRWPFTINRDSPQAEELHAWFPLLPGVDLADVFDLAEVRTGTLATGNSWVTDSVISWMLDFSGTSSDFGVGTYDPPGQGTISFWLKMPDNVGTKMRFFGFADAFELVVKESSGFLANDLYMAGTGDLEGSIDIADNTLRHFACTWDFSTQDAEIYTDGVLDTSTATNVDDDPGSGTLFIGSRSGSDLYTGQLGDLRIMHRVLSADDAWRLWAPETRWDLYYELGRVLYSFPPTRMTPTVAGGIVSGIAPGSLDLGLPTGTTVRGT